MLFWKTGLKLGQITCSWIAKMGFPNPDTYIFWTTSPNAYTPNLEANFIHQYALMCHMMKVTDFWIKPLLIFSPGVKSYLWPEACTMKWYQWVSYWFLGFIQVLVLNSSTLKDKVNNCQEPDNSAPYKYSAMSLTESWEPNVLIITWQITDDSVCLKRSKTLKLYQITSTFSLL